MVYAGVKLAEGYVKTVKKSAILETTEVEVQTGGLL